MLSINKFFDKHAKNTLTFFYRLSVRYQRWFKGYSYDPKENGEYNLLNKLEKSSHQVIFDVGANVGEWTDTILNKFEIVECHCFEVFPVTATKLQERFKYDSRVRVNDIGLGATQGVARLKVYDDKSTVNTLVSTLDFHRDQSSRIIDVNITTGDIYASTNGISRISLLKIDVEGVELDVLRGFSDLLSNNLIDLVQFEYGYANGEAGALMKDFYCFFDSFNYIVGRLEKTGVSFSKFDYSFNNFESGPNFVAVSRSNVKLIERISTV